MPSESPDLGVVFESEADFRREFETNLVHGGLFVPTELAFEVRAQIMLGIDLAYCGQSLVLEGEVVHQVPVELGAVGARPGVALQLLLPATDLREKLEGLEGAFTPDFQAPPAELPDVDPERERRGARRGKARVSARLETEDGELQEGRTRNVSSSGLLFEVTQEPVKIDDAVTLHLTHPVSGVEQAIAGRVVRHLANEDGVVRALGIRFEPESGRPPEIEHFLEDLMAVEHSRHLGGIAGSISEVGAMSLVQNFSQSTPQGTLTLAMGADEGSIAFDEGMLVSARLGPLMGTKALSRLLVWEEGRFEFHAQIDPSIATEDPIPMQGAMMEAARQIDEVGRLDLLALPPFARLEMGSGAPDVLGGGLDKLEEAVADLCVGKTTVRRIVDVIPEPDADIYKAILFLVDQDAIRVVRD